MNRAVNNICKIEIARRSEVAEFYETPTGLAVISAPWTKLPLARPAVMGIRQVNTPSGDRYDVDLSASLSQAWMVRELCLVRIYFDDGSDPMLIGSMDFPVKLEESHDQTSKRISFSHSNTHYPFRIDPDYVFGSGSGGSTTPGSEIPDPVPVTIAWELSEWDAAPDFIDANMRIYANEVLVLERFATESGTIEVFVGDTIRVQYFYLDIAEGSPVSPFLQLLIDSVLIASEPVDIPGEEGFNHTFTIDSNKEILVRAIDLG